MKTTRMGTAKLLPVEKETLQNRIFDRLAQALMSGALVPGQSVTLRGLAEQLGTSVMPIRDAIRRLVSDQALEMATARSVRVPLMSLQRYESVLNLRVMLEGEAAARAANHARSADLKQLKALNERYIRALQSGHWGTILSSNQEFHFAVYRLADDPLLQLMIEKAWLLSGPYLGFLRDVTSGLGKHPSTREHTALLKAIENGDGPAARVAIEVDIKSAADLYRKMIREQ